MLPQQEMRREEGVVACTAGAADGSHQVPTRDEERRGSSSFGSDGEIPLIPHQQEMRREEGVVAVNDWVNRPWISAPNEK